MPKWAYFRLVNYSKYPDLISHGMVQNQPNVDLFMQKMMADVDILLEVMVNVRMVNVRLVM